MNGPSREERNERNQVLYSILMKDHDSDMFEKTSNPHEAAHNFLARHMKVLDLTNGDNLIHDSEASDRVETAGGVQYSFTPTALGHLVNAVICSWTDFFLQRFVPIGVGSMGDGLSGLFVVNPEVLKGYLADLINIAMRLALAHRDGKLDDYYSSRTATLPEQLQNWVLAPDNEEDSDE